MEMQLLPWIKDDIAIEIICRMSAEQVEQVYKLIAEYKQAGVEQDSQEVLSDPRYQQLMNRIGEFKAEIDQIYEGNNVEELHRKVDEEYVPHLNKRPTETETVKFFNETKGFGFIKEDESGKDVFVTSSNIPASNINDHEDRKNTSASTTQVSDHT